MPLNIHSQHGFMPKVNPSFGLQCFALQINIDVKWITKINAHKMTVGIPTSCYSYFWVQF